MWDGDTILIRYPDLQGERYVFMLIAGYIFTFYTIEEIDKKFSNMGNSLAPFAIGFEGKHLYRLSDQKPLDQI